MEEFPKANDNENSIEEEKMVECTKLSTVFNDPKVLESIADDLMSEGVISGFSVEPIKAGYVYEGKMVEGGQFKLEILLGSKSDEENKRKIILKINEIIGVKWEVPAIQEQSVNVNERFLNFIKRAEVEHKRYRRERKMKLTLAVAALTAISGVIGTVSKRYVDNKKQEFVAAERIKAYDRLNELQHTIELKIRDIDAKIANKEPFHESNTDMGGFAGYDETWEVINLVRDTEYQSLKLTDPERYTQAEKQLEEVNKSIEKQKEESKDKE